MELTREYEAEVYSHLMDDGFTVKAGTSLEWIEKIRELNEKFGDSGFNLSVAEGRDTGEAPNTGLSATLPKDKELRDALLAQLRGRFGAERVAALDDVVLIVDEKKDLGEWTDAPKCACTLIFKDSDVIVACDDRFDFSELSFTQEKVARFVLEKPTRAKLRGENDFTAARKTSVGEFAVSGKFDVWLNPETGKCVSGWIVSFEGFVPAKP